MLTPNFSAAYARCTLLMCFLVSVLTLDVTLKSDTSVSGFTTAEKNALVNIHNAYRSAVDPTASDMLEVQWNDDIATVAQNWANQCTGTHASGPTAAGSPLSENLYWYFGNSYSELNGIAFWYDENVHYSFNSNTCAGSQVCGHYKIMVLSTINYIGCGIKHCSRLTGLSNTRSAFYLVCNYNYTRPASHPISYTQGTPCSNCPADANRCRHRLCIPNSFSTSDGYDGDLSVIGISRPTIDDGDGDDENAATNLPISQCLLFLAFLIGHVFQHQL